MKQNKNSTKDYQQPITIVYAEDHVLIRKSVCELINGFGIFKVIQQADNGKSLLKNMQDKKLPDIALLDIEMPEMNGYETARIIKEKYPAIKIIMLTVFDSEHALARSIQCGANALIPKSVEPQQLKQLLLNVVNEEAFCRKLNPLSEQEYELLKWICTDASIEEISDKMQLSKRTAERIKETLAEKFGVKGRMALGNFAMANGLGFFADRKLIGLTIN